MKHILLLLLLLPLLANSQKLVQIRISYQTSQTNQNTVHIDSVLFEQGFGQGPALKFHLLLFDEDCEHVDSLDFGEHNPFLNNFKAYHFRQIEMDDMVQLDSTLKYRIPDGMHYFLYTPCQYRSDFVSAANYPTLQTIDSLWGSQVANASTALILYGKTGDLSSYESIVVDPSNVVTGMTKNICLDAGINEQERSSLEPLIYPNPTDNQVNISFQNSRERLFLLYNSLGQLMFELNSENTLVEIDLTNLERGHYLLKILNGQNSCIKSIVLE